MTTGTLTARHRDNGRWYEAGDRITLVDDDAALLIAEGKFTPDPPAAQTGKPPVGIPSQPVRKVGLTSED